MLDVPRITTEVKMTLLEQYKAILYPPLKAAREDTLDRQCQDPLEIFRGFIWAAMISTPMWIAIGLIFRMIW